MSKIKLTETTLPGVGIRRDFLTAQDDRIGVIQHHSGRLDLLVYDEFDPDSCRSSIALTEDEGRVLADLLGATQIVKSMERVRQEIGGIAIDWIEITNSWVCADSRIEALKLAQTGVLIVAVIRHGETTPIPKADFVLQAGDTIVVVGTPEGIQIASAIMQRGD